MQYRPLGASGIQASVVALGTWAIGGWMWGGTDERKAIEAVKAAVDSEVNFIDTAPAYGLGLSEELVGRAIEGRRDKVVLATKCSLVWHTDKGKYHFEQHGKKVHLYAGPDSIRYEVEQSLRRLRTDYIDLYQTHWQDSTTPIEDTMAALLDLKDKGKIRAIGASNANLSQIKRYCKVGPLDCDQEKFSMIDRYIEKANLPFCRENNIAVLAYSPLAMGLLTGKIGPDREFQGDDLRKTRPQFSIENRRRIAAMLDKFKPVCEEHGITLAQLAIAWTITQPGVTHALCGGRNAEQATENARAGDVVLSEEDLGIINGAISEYLSQTDAD